MSEELYSWQLVVVCMCGTVYLQKTKLTIIVKMLRKKKKKKKKYVFFPIFYQMAIWLILTAS